jgi:hypothetical protein
MNDFKSKNEESLRAYVGIVRRLFSLFSEWSVEKLDNFIKDNPVTDEEYIEIVSIMKKKSSPLYKALHGKKD